MCAYPAVVIGAWPVEPVDCVSDIWPHCDQMCRVCRGKVVKRMVEDGRRVALPGWMFY